MMTEIKDNQPQDQRRCHAEGERCLGCDHYYGKAPVCSYAKPEPQEQAPAPKLTTWKKDFIPLHEKLDQGLPLTPDEARRLAQYNIQRESEYATGISMRKDRATRLESVEKAIEPFLPLLQQHNVTPDRWIQSLGQAHQTLAMGTPEQKLQAFQRLANDYGINLGAVQQSQNGLIS